MRADSIKQSSRWHASNQLVAEILRIHTVGVLMWANILHGADQVILALLSVSGSELIGWVRIVTIFCIYVLRNLPRSSRVRYELLLDSSGLIVLTHPDYS